MSIKKITLLLIFSLSMSLIYGKDINLSRVSVIISSDIKPKVQQSAMRILKEEVKRRTGIEWKKIEKWSSAKKHTIALVLSGSIQLVGNDIPLRADKNLPEWQAEGFRQHVRLLSQW